MSSFAIDLSNRTALVTGASSGIGRHIATLLAENGASVVVVARRRAALEELSRGIEAAGGRALPIFMDVMDRQSITEAISLAGEKFGEVDILVNNSGVAVSKPALEQTEDDWDTVLDTNARGAFFVTIEVARRLVAAERPGSIINIASILGVRQASMVCPYAASKAALIQMTKCLALELSRYSIRVNAIAPGYIESEMNSEFLASAAGRASISRVPQRRLGTPEDLNGAVLLLASDLSAYMTGAVISVDGGHLTSML